MSTAARSAAKFIVNPDTVIEANGQSAPFELGPFAGKRVLVVLRVSEVVEQESLHVSIWGSADGADWGAKAIFAYPQKFYCGATPAALDLAQRPEAKFLQARWETNRWGRGYPRPYFHFAVEVEDLPL